MSISEAFIIYDRDMLLAKGKSLKTRKNYRSSLSSFLKVWGDLSVGLIALDAIDHWRREKERLGIQHSSMASNLSHLREVLKYLKKHGVDVIDWKDIERPSIVQKDPTWLEVDEIKRLLAVIENPRDKALIACLFSTGARISELLSLDRDSICNGEASITGKGNKLGTLHFDGVALRYLDEYLGTRTDRLRPLFISAQRRRITVQRVEQFLHEYADYAGIDKNVTPHVLRHSFATDLKSNGADIYDIMTQLRHTNISTTQIYTHVNDQRKKELYSKFHSKVPMV